MRAHVRAGAPVAAARLYRHSGDFQLAPTDSAAAQPTAGAATTLCGRGGRPLRLLPGHLRRHRTGRAVLPRWRQGLVLAGALCLWDPGTHFKRSCLEPNQQRGVWLCLQCSACGPREEVRSTLTAFEDDDSCTYASNNTCQDGRPSTEQVHSSFVVVGEGVWAHICAYLTNKTDCVNLGTIPSDESFSTAPRPPLPRPPPPDLFPSPSPLPPTVSCTYDCPIDSGYCSDGGSGAPTVGHDLATGAPLFECSYGTQCDRGTGCGPRAPLNALNEICTDLCREGIRGGVQWTGRALNSVYEDEGEYYNHEFVEGLVTDGDTGVQYRATSGCGYGENLAPTRGTRNESQTLTLCSRRYRLHRLQHPDCRPRDPCQRVHERLHGLRDNLLSRHAGARCSGRGGLPQLSRAIGWRRQCEHTVVC